MNKLYFRRTIAITLALVSVFSTTVFSDDLKESDVFTSIGVENTKPVKNTNTSLYVQVNCDNLNMRADSNTDTRIIRTLPNKYALSVLGAEYGWLQVQDDEGNTGYVKAEFVTFNIGTKPSNKELTENSKAAAIVNYSKKFIGTPYVWGGTNLTAGVDCSGFIYSVFKNFGITLNRSSKAMYSGNGVSVGKSNLKQGDLLFFNTSGSGVSHVGMYIGNDQYIHSSTGGVQITSLSSAYSLKTYVGAKRVLV